MGRRAGSAAITDARHAALSLAQRAISSSVRAQPVQSPVAASMAQILMHGLATARPDADRLTRTRP